MANSLRLSILFLAVVLMTACQANPASETLIIENFKSGLVCPQKGVDDQYPAEHSKICRETENITISGDGECVFNRELVACTWYGFQFDYKNAQPNHEISCHVTASQPIGIGNPEKTINESTSTYKYAFNLPTGNGHIFNPQYTVFQPNLKAEYQEIIITKCYDGKREILKITRKSKFPKAADNDGNR